MNTRVLLVDDDPNVLGGYQRALRKQFEFETALGGTAALHLMEQSGPPAVIVADMQMPGMNGIQLLKEAQARWPDTVRIMLTGNADERTARDAVNQGYIFRFLTKPCPPEELAQNLAAGVRQHQLMTAEREVLEKTLTGVVKLLTEILANTDPRSLGLGQRMREHIRRLLQRFPYPQPWQLEVAAELSSVGSVTVPPVLLKKAASGIQLNEDEKELLAGLPEMGARLLENIPRLELVAQIIRYQNKNFDGTGFPAEPMSGQQIPLGARILRVAGEWVQLETGGLTRARSAELMRARRGWFDPAVLEAMLAAGGEGGTPVPEAILSVRNVTVDELHVGMAVCSDVETPDGVLLLAAGATLTPMMLQTLRNFARLDNLKQPIRIRG